MSVENTPPKSYLFVPGNRPERFNKALASGADRIIVDLEDAVAPADKTSAQKAISEWLPTLSSTDASKIIVRINDANSSWFSADLQWLGTVTLSAVMLPKCEFSQTIEQVAKAMRQPTNNKCVIALIESAKGVAKLSQICEAPRLERLAFGSIDYALDMGLPQGLNSGMALDYAACAIAIASKAADLTKPIAGVTAGLDAGLVTEAMKHELSLGFAAKMCIHPVQVLAIHEVLIPSAAQLEWARHVLAAWQEHGASGSILVNGEMVDKPVFLRALQIIQAI